MMQINSGEIIRKIREDMGLSQGEMAARLFLEQKKISRIEKGTMSIDIWQLMQMLELLGYPSEDFWLLYLESEEYEGYRTYRLLKKQLWDNDFASARVTLTNIKQSPLAEQPLINQFLELASVMLDDGISDEDAIEKLYKALRLSSPDFDETKIAEYRLTYNEIYILISITSLLSKIGNKEKAISVTKAIIESRENSRTSEEDRAKLFPALMFNLSNFLGQSGKTKEALKVCNQAIEVCREHKKLDSVPQILLNIASCHHILGEQEHVYKTYLVRAYHAAYAHGENELGQRIKKYAEEDFGITIIDI